ncbi:DUF2207 domain-containing protein [Spongiivirga citrea]|uniref:Uncharacterized protein n=1 Tax=Spongiivirga citrea TaxID=1481457 RepID=A0A6M0CES2_9FLAO|nr:DUF2207 domain-containing protein [Spongiivirga citrea]NER16316.1 hypothetical protein [Spongiivirga citrea]
MSVKTKALIFNFICFAILFLAFRFGISALGLQLPYIPLVVISVVLASLIAPKFGVRTKDGKEVLIMKTFLRKDIKEF